MQKIKAKLNSKRGVSLMLALLLFLLCALSGAAAITAAGSNIGRYSYMREYQQEYLTVSSAAKLLKAQFEQGAGYSISDRGAGTELQAIPVYALFSYEMKTLLSDAYLIGTGAEPVGTIYSASPKEFVITVDGDDTFDPVNAVVTFNKPDAGSADIKVELSCGEQRLEFTVDLTFETSGDNITVTKAEIDRITLPG